MNTTDTDILLSQLLEEYGQGSAEREEIRVWVGRRPYAIRQQRDGSGQRGDGRFERLDTRCKGLDGRRRSAHVDHATTTHGAL